MEFTASFLLGSREVVRLPNSQGTRPPQAPAAVSFRTWPAMRRSWGVDGRKGPRRPNTGLRALRLPVTRRCGPGRVAPPLCFHVCTIEQVCLPSRVPGRLKHHDAEKALAGGAVIILWSHPSRWNGCPGVPKLISPSDLGNSFRTEFLNFSPSAIWGGIILMGGGGLSKHCM